MSGIIYICAVFCALCLLLCGRRQKEQGSPGFPVWAGLLLLGALALRLALGYNSDGFSVDMDTFKSWGMTLGRVGLSEIYQQDMFLDYPPGYLYVLMLLEKIRQWTHLAWEGQMYTLVMKLPSIGADLLCGGALLWLGRRKLGDRAALLVSAAYLFCPAVFVNSVQWGQADSFCTMILVCSALLLYGEKWIPSGLLYGLAVICKPQMLAFAPMYIFFAVKRRKWAGLGVGIVCAIGAVLLVAAPFTKSFDYWWLVQKYQSTMDYYNYYSVNAYNFWTFIGRNWWGLPGGISGALLTWTAPVIATAACGGLMLFSKRKDAVFAAAPLLMGIVYIFGVKMHERYLFPAFIFILLCYLFTRDRRLIRAFAFMAGANYLNVSYTLWIFREKGNNYDPNSQPGRIIALLQIAALLYLIWVDYSVYIMGGIKEPKEGEPFLRQSREPIAPPEDRRLSRPDWALMLGITLIYGVVAFWQLGDRSLPLTNWTPEEGQSVVLETDRTCHILYYLPGLEPDGQHYRARVGSAMRVESSEDGVTWEDCGELENAYVFAWCREYLEVPGKYVRVTALDGNVTVSEMAIVPAGSDSIPAITATGPGAELLTDEQGTVPLYKTYENSSYFDEIYHARTAYEHILGLEPYENTHPPLGKHIISLGIRVFGMNPFGWRFMGTLFGVLMLPALYVLCKDLFGKTWLCALGTLMFAFDFMHFTQTRIATIDTYSVFFLLLMYDAMVRFMHKDIVRAKLRELLLPLALGGVFMGLGIASKWTAAYGAVGLAVLYFGKLLHTCLYEKKAGGLTPALRRCGVLCGWCCLLFLAVPLGIYFCAFLPMTTLSHNRGDMLWAFWNYQTTMFNYHSGLVAEHSFASPWYDWPLDVRPIWFFSSDPCNELGQYSTISSMGSPLLWWGCLPALAYALWEWLRKRSLYCAVALTGFLSVYLPWVLVPRLTFIYHYFTAVPFLVLALLALFKRLSESGPLSGRVTIGGRIEVRWAQLLMGAMAVGCVALFIVYFPIISGAPTTRGYADSLELFESWYFG